MVHRPHRICVTLAVAGSDRLADPLAVAARRAARTDPEAVSRRRASMLGLTDDEAQTDRTPWWLLLLRTLAIAAAIIGFAGPVLNPKPDNAGDGPLLVLLDGSWGEAPRLDRNGSSGLTRFCPMRPWKGARQPSSR